MSAIIPINNKYRIELDIYSWQVSKWRTRKSAPEGGCFEGISWHPKLQQAGESLVKRFVAEAELEGVQEVIYAIQAASELILRSIRESEIPDSWLDAEKRYKE